MMRVQPTVEELQLDAAAETAALILYSKPVAWPDDIDLPMARLRIECAEHYQAVESLWKQVKTRIKEIQAFFEPRKAEARKVWQRWVDDEHASIDRYIAAEKAAKEGLSAYDERKRLDAAEKQRRLDREAQARAEAAQLSAALQADADGAVTDALEILDEPAPVEMTVVRRETPNTVPMVERWSAEVKDLDQLILAAASEITAKAPRVAASMLKADASAINRQATAMKENLRKIAAGLGLVVSCKRTPRMSS